MKRKISLCSAFGVAFGMGLKTWREIRDIAPLCRPGDSIQFTATVTMTEDQGKTCWANIKEGME